MDCLKLFSIAVTASLWLNAAGTVRGQVAQPRSLSSETCPRNSQSLDLQRSRLIEEARKIQNELNLHNQKCSRVRDDDSQLIKECASNQASLLAEIRKHNNAVGDLDNAIETDEEQFRSCAAVAHQVQSDREAIERQIETNELSNQELAEWNAFNRKAQTMAVIAGVKFVFGEFVSDITPVRLSVSKLERQVADLIKKAAQSKKASTRLKYLAQLESTLNQLEPLRESLLEKVVAETGLQAEKVWGVARDTMQHEFRTARNQFEAIQETLNDPKFKESFTGDEIDTPGLDVLSTLAEQAGDEIGKSLIRLERYERLAAPRVRAAVFVRDAAYSAVLSLLSTQRVLQQSEVANLIALSGKTLQQRYKTSVDAFQLCQQAGCAK